jgi:hypothetical protein
MTFYPFHCPKFPFWGQNQHLLYQVGETASAEHCSLDINLVPREFPADLTR